MSRSTAPPSPCTTTSTRPSGRFFACPPGRVRAPARGPRTGTRHPGRRPARRRSPAPYPAPPAHPMRPARPRPRGRRVPPRHRAVAPPYARDRGPDGEEAASRCRRSNGRPRRRRPRRVPERPRRRSVISTASTGCARSRSRAVLVYHLDPAWLPGGFLGVDVFFVVSGFLITTLLQREALAHGRIALGRFWSRRARRLLPALRRLRRREHRRGAGRPPRPASWASDGRSSAR